jgi:lysophospholipase L1-like esterase
MHKRLSARVVAAAVIFFIALLSVSFVGADSSSAWLSSVLSVKKQADMTSLPSTVSGRGNIDCYEADSSGCEFPDAYGTASPNSSIRLSSSGSSTPVMTYVDQRPHLFAVPNSAEGISIYSGPPYGSYMAFNYDFMSKAVLKDDGAFHLTSPPDGKLTDKVKHLLAADTLSMSFSENGRWMAISSPNLAILRVNLVTFEVVPFAPGLNYMIGLDPDVKTAISDDGRYAVVASNTFNVFKIYDLSTCQAVPDTINSPITCQSRDLGSVMRQAETGYYYVNQVRFFSDEKLSVYASYKSGTISHTARYIISTSYTPNQLDYLALGDSYISGEGAFDYMSGTDTDTNKCHLSFLAYPFLIGKDLNYNSYHSVACSGAVTDDIKNTSDSYAGQADSGKFSRAQLDAQGLTSNYLDSFLPGYIDQLDFVKTYQPKAITVSIGGNDMGFSNILTQCVEPKFSNTCYNTYEDRLEIVRQINKTVYPRLVQTYQKLKPAGPPDMGVYIIGYPQIAKPGGDCGLNVHLNNDEIIFSQELISYLDTVIQTAAAKAGVYYVDAQDSLYGHRLCEAEPGSLAVNGLTAGNDKPTKLKGPLGDESYHPNDFGYMLLENKILSATHNLTNPMPPADPSVKLPSENGLEILNIGHDGRTVNTTMYDPAMSADQAYEQTPIDIKISGTAYDIKPASTFQAELHTTPIGLGQFISDAGGNVTAQITIPASVPAGYHTLHFYGPDLTGQTIDIYKYIYVAASQNDIDGNGVMDSYQACVGVVASGQDFDKDGIDDSCDGNITLPPVPQASSSDKQPPAESASGANQNDSQVLAIQTSAQLPNPGIDNSDVLTSASKILGASTDASPDKSAQLNASDAGFPNLDLLSIGLIIVLAGGTGLALSMSGNRG